MPDSIQSELPAALTEAWALCQTQCWRLPLWLAGDASWLWPQWQQLQARLPADAQIFWLGEAAPASNIEVQQPITYLNGQSKQQVLGQECDVLVINSLTGVDWDMVAASSGCVKAGGLWLWLSSDANTFATAANPAAKRLLSYPQQATLQPSLFQAFWLQSISQQPLLQWTIAGLSNGIQSHSNCYTRQENSSQVAAPAALLAEATSGSNRHTAAAATVHLPTAPQFPSNPTLAPFFTVDQQQAAAAIYQMMQGHRHRPLVLSAHRGRGKSAVLGIAAAQLQLQAQKLSRPSRIVITAPQPAAAAVALRNYQQQRVQHPELAAQPELQFMPLDQLLAEAPELDLLLIDEAAAIPSPQLQQLVQRYSRVVFATTEHGYEGTGRGFQLRFQQYLDQHKAGWKKQLLHSPIRYAPHDPLEQLIFNSLLLNVEYQTPQYQPALATQLNQWRSSELLAQPALLGQLFALLSLAHYQTSVRDLWALLDDQALQIFTLQQDQQLLGAAVMVVEGELESNLCSAIAQGQRRVQGHLLAQNLAFHLLSPALAQRKLVRVQRIVISPPLQRLQLGSAMLQQLISFYQQLDFQAIGSSFGANLPLVQFWHLAGFVPVKLGHKLEQSSAEPSVLMVRALQPALHAELSDLQQRFASDLYSQLSLQQQHLCPALALLWARAPIQTFSDLDKQQLQLFCAEQRPFELIEPALQRWFEQQTAELPATFSQILVQRYWQKHSLESLRLSQHFPTKMAIIAAIRIYLSAFIT